MAEKLERSLQHCCERKKAGHLATHPLLYLAGSVVFRSRKRSGVIRSMASGSVLKGTVAWDYFFSDLILSRVKIKDLNLCFWFKLTKILVRQNIMLFSPLSVKKDCESFFKDKDSENVQKFFKHTESEFIYTKLNTAKVFKRARRILLKNMNVLGEYALYSL